MSSRPSSSFVHPLQPNSTSQRQKTRSRSARDGEFAPWNGQSSRLSFDIRRLIDHGRSAPQSIVHNVWAWPRAAVGPSRCLDTSRPARTADTRARSSPEKERCRFASAVAASLRRISILSTGCPYKQTVSRARTDERWLFTGLKSQTRRFAATHRHRQPCASWFRFFVWSGSSSSYSRFSPVLLASWRRSGSGCHSTTERRRQSRRRSRCPPRPAPWEKKRSRTSRPTRDLRPPRYPAPYFHRWETLSPGFWRTDLTKACGRNASTT